MLYALWDKLALPHEGDWASRAESLSLIYSRARNRSRRVLEHLFRAHSTEVLEAIVDCWYEQVLVGCIGSLLWIRIDIYYRHDPTMRRRLRHITLWMC